MAGIFMLDKQTYVRYNDKEIEYMFEFKTTVTYQLGNSISHKKSQKI